MVDCRTEPTITGALALVTGQAIACDERAPLHLTWSVCVMQEK